MARSCVRVNECPLTLACSIVGASTLARSLRRVAESLELVNLDARAVLSKLPFDETLSGLPGAPEDAQARYLEATVSVPSGVLRLIVMIGFAATAQVLVTMGCGDACPIYPGKRYEDWPVDDPAGRSVAEVRPIRDDIERRVRRLLDELGVPATR